jgi:hypothetical protein
VYTLLLVVVPPPLLLLLLLLLLHTCAGHMDCPCDRPAQNSKGVLKKTAAW